MGLFTEGDYNRVQEYFRHNPDAMKDAKAGGRPDLSKMPRDLRFTVECTAGLIADAPVLLAGGEDGLGEPSLTTMKTIFSVHSGKNLPIFAVGRDTEGNIDMFISHMIGLPKELQVDTFVDIGFTEGFGYKLASGASFMRDNGTFANVKDIKVGDKLQGFTFNGEGGAAATTFEVNKINITKSLIQPVYLFMSEHGNMLLPHVAEGNDHIDFVCIKQ